MESKKTWKIDPAHSQIQFLPFHMGINFIPGRFEAYDGEIRAAKNDFSDLEAELTIDVKSLNTGNEDRDKHLHSDDFFNSEKYPKLIFRSKSVKADGDKLKVTGDITIRDVTKEIELNATHKGTITDPYGKRRAGFTLEGTVNRMDHGLKWNEQYNRGPVVDENVKLKCNVEIVKQE